MSEIAGEYDLHGAGYRCRNAFVRRRSALNDRAVELRTPDRRGMYILRDLLAAQQKSPDWPFYWLDSAVTIFDD